MDKTHRKNHFLFLGNIVCRSLQHLHHNKFFLWDPLWMLLEMMSKNSNGHISFKMQPNKTCDLIFVKTCFNYFSVVKGHLNFSSMKGKCFKNCNVWSYDNWKSKGCVTMFFLWHLTIFLFHRNTSSLTLMFIKSSWEH